MSDTVILITGQLTNEFTDRLIKCYSNIKDKLVSTWNYTDKDIIQKLKSNDFMVILIDDETIKKDQHKHNRQLLPIRNGILEAKRLGYKYVLKSRNDVFSNDFERFLTVTQHLYKEKIMAISGIFTKPAGAYFLDILVCGSVDNMLKMFVVKDPGNKRAFEPYLIETYTNMKKLSKEQLKNHMAFCLEECKRNDIEFIWHRDKKWKTPKRTIPDMKVIKEYCDDEFIFC